MFLLSDYGFSGYATTIITRRDFVDKNPDLVQRSSTPPRSAGIIISMATTPRPTTAIKQDNPEMTDEQIAYSIAKLKEYGIVNSGDALDQGHRRDDRRAGQGLLRQDGEGRAGQTDTDYKKAFTLQFVNKGVGSICGRSEFMRLWLKNPLAVLAERARKAAWSSRERASPNWSRGAPRPRRPTSGHPTRRPHNPPTAESKPPNPTRPLPPDQTRSDRHQRAQLRTQPPGKRRPQQPPAYGRTAARFATQPPGDA